jgi:6,7-dimethyl-8-ribityllumazine synthase
MRFAIVASRWTDFLTSKLIDGVLDALGAHGANEKDIEVFRVPGSFELPFTSMEVAKAGRFDAVIAIGVVIRGETPHFDYVAGEAAKGIGQVGIDTGVPVMFGVVTANTLEQAINRSGVKSGNKGYEAAISAIEVVDLHRQIADKDREKGKDRAVSHVV